MGAAKAFEWALALNENCVTCMKNLGEALMAMGKEADAEKVRIKMFCCCVALLAVPCSPLTSPLSVVNSAILKGPGAYTA